MARKGKGDDDDTPKITTIQKYLVHEEDEEHRIFVEHEKGHDFVEMIISNGGQHDIVSFTVAEFEDFILKLAHVKDIAQGRGDD